MRDANADPGWWNCDACGGDVRPIDAHTKTVPTHEGTELLAFCETCTEDDHA
jgi:hypothetical protein